MSQLLVDDIVDKDGCNSVGFSKGINVSASSTITGNLNVTGVLTYEDVTNVDSVGVITAQGGIKIGAAGVGGTIAANGDTTLAGVVTATSFSGDGSALTGLANTDFINATQLNVIGVATATTFVGNLTGDPTGTVQTAAQPNITSVGTLTNLVATASSVTGISSVGLAITMYGSSGIVSATSFYGDGANLSNVPGGIGGMVVLTSGTGATWSIPAGVTTIKVICTGGGGGATGPTNPPGDEGSGGAGGSGGTSIHYYDVSGGGTATYTIGAGGAAHGNTGSAGNGGDSTFAYGGTTITGGGGTGGTASSGAGGAGGTASGGTLNLPGNGGEGGIKISIGQGVVNPQGGASYWGAGVGRGIRQGQGSDTGTDGAANTGAGGNASTNNSNDGGAGGSGIIVIEY